MAKFKFKHAVMSAGKSQELARVHYNYNIKGEDVLVLVPSTDNRNGVGVVSARSGEKLKAVAVNPGEMRTWLAEYLENTEEDLVCVLMDETQFFERDDIFSVKELCVLERDIPVIAYGLKTDFQNKIFEGSSASLVVAEEIIEIETVCAFCNKRATMNLRFNDGYPTKSGEQIQIGDEEYRPVCHKHYNDESLFI